jgi:hypothetical protein
MLPHKEILNFYINSSIHVALAVCSLTYITILEFDVPLNNTVFFFVFFASITAYNFVKYFGVVQFYHVNLTRWLKWIQILSFISFILMCYYGFYLSMRTLIYLAVLGLITFLYAVPFLPNKKLFNEYKSLRNIGGLKVFLIALVWCGVTVFIPIINNDSKIDIDIVITGIQRFLFVIMLMLPFEIRDLQFDSLKLFTIPQKLGLVRTKLLGVALGVVIFSVEFLKSKITFTSVLILLGIDLLTIVLIMFSKENQGKYFASFWIEGIPILWLLLLLIFI